MTPEHIALGEGPESLASLCLHLRRMSDGQGDQIDADRLSRCADLIEAQAAEIAQLKADYEDAFARGMAHGQQAMPKGTFRVVDSAAIATLRAERNALRSAASPVIELLDGLVAESGRGVDWGEEDAFRMGEWFEAHDIAAIERLRVLKGGA